MISPHTPPGTRIVCIAEPDKPHPDYAGKHMVVKGAVYTVARIDPDSDFDEGFYVGLMEAPDDHAYGLGLFELAALPKAITDCLEVVDLPLIIDEFKRQDADADARLRMPY